MIRPTNWHQVAHNPVSYTNPEVSISSQRQDLLKEDMAGERAEEWALDGKKENSAELSSLTHRPEEDTSPGLSL